MQSFQEYICKSLMKWMTGWKSPCIFSNQSSLGCFFHPLDILSPRWWAPAVSTKWLESLDCRWNSVRFANFDTVGNDTGPTWYEYIPGSSKCVYKILCLFHQKTYTTKRQAFYIFGWSRYTTIYIYMYDWYTNIIIYMPSCPYWLTNHSSRRRNEPNEWNDRRWWGHSNRTMKSTWG